MSRQNAEEAKTHSQAARQPEEDRKSILLWRSPLDSPDKKHCPLKSWPKHYEARRMKKSQIIWHKWGKLPFKNKKWTERLSTTSVFTGRSLFLQHFPKLLHCSGLASLFHLDASQELYRQQCNYAHQASSWLQNGPVLSYSNLESDSKTKTGKNTDFFKIALYLWCHIKEQCVLPWIQWCFCFFPLCVKCKIHTEWGRKRDGQSLTGLQLPHSSQPHGMKPSALSP